MRSAYLLSLGACVHHCCTSEGLVVLRDHTNCVCGVAATMYRRKHGPWRFGRKLDSEDGGEHSGRGLPEGTPETHLHMGKAQGYPRSYPTRSLALARDSLRGAPTRTRGSLRASRYLGKNTEVIDGSLHISTLLFSFRIYINCITPFAVEIATHWLNRSCTFR